MQQQLTYFKTTDKLMNMQNKVKGAVLSQTIPRGKGTVPALTNSRLKTAGKCAEPELQRLAHAYS